MKNLDKSNIEDTVQKTIHRWLNIELKDITAEKTLKDDLDVDSLDTIELVMAFEEIYSIEIDDAEIEKLETVQDIIDKLKEKVE